MKQLTKPSAILIILALLVVDGATLGKLGGAISIIGLFIWLYLVGVVWSYTKPEEDRKAIKAKTPKVSRTFLIILSPFLLIMAWFAYMALHP